MNSETNPLPSEQSTTKVNGETFSIINKDLGSGTMGRVFLVKDNQGRQFAIKEAAQPTNPEDRLAIQENLSKEAELLKILNEINHPALAKFFKFDSSRQPPAILFEYVPGQTLDERDSSIAMSEAEIMHIIRTVGSALAAMHLLPLQQRAKLVDLDFGSPTPNGIIHFDVKPGNIIATSNPDRPFVLIDHGTAAAGNFSPYATHPRMRTEAEPFGTPPYADPIFAKDKNIDPASDVYSFAATILDLALPGGIPQPVHNEMFKMLAAQTVVTDIHGSPLQKLVSQTNLSDRLKDVLSDALSLGNRQIANMRKFLERLAKEDNEAYRVDADGLLTIDVGYFPTEKYEEFKQLIRSVEDQSEEKYYQKLDMLSFAFSDLKPHLSSIREGIFPYAELIQILIRRSSPPRIYDRDHPFLKILRDNLDQVIDPASLLEALAYHPDPIGTAQVLGNALKKYSDKPQFHKALEVAFIEPKRRKSNEEPKLALNEQVRLLSIVEYLAPKAQEKVYNNLKLGGGYASLELTLHPITIKWIIDSISIEVVALENKKDQQDQNPNSPIYFKLYNLMAVGEAMISRWFGLGPGRVRSGDQIPTELLTNASLNIPRLITVLARYQAQFKHLTGLKAEKGRVNIAQILYESLLTANLALYPEIVTPILRGVQQSPELANHPDIISEYAKRRISIIVNRLLKNLDKPDRLEEDLTELELFCSLHKGSSEPWIKPFSELDLQLLKIRDDLTKIGDYQNGRRLQLINQELNKSRGIDAGPLTI